MVIKYPSKEWDDNLKRETEADIRNGEPEKEKIEVVTEDEEPELWSGLYCVFCHDFATFIYKGDSICHTCYNKEVSNMIKENRK